MRPLRLSVFEALDLVLGSDGMNAVAILVTELEPELSSLLWAVCFRLCPVSSILGVMWNLPAALVSGVARRCHHAVTSGNR